MEYLEHKKKVFEMLVSVLRTTLKTSVMRMRSMVVEWGAFPEKVSDYVTGLVEKTHKFHRLLAKILNQADLEVVLNNVLKVYNAMLGECYRGLDLRTKNQRLRLRNDVRLLTEGLAQFEGVASTLGDSLQQEVESKYPD